MKRLGLLAAALAGLGALSGCASPVGGRLPPAGAASQQAVAYERSSCCELEDPSFHHLPLMSEARVAERYRFRVATEPSPAVAGIPLGVHVFIEGADEAGELGTHPERRPNFAVLSDNLGELHHFHPEDLGAWREAALFEGRFTLPLTFRQGGLHWIIVDFLEKATVVRTALPLEVSGPAQESTAWDLVPIRVLGDLELRFRGAPATPRAGSLFNGIVSLSMGGAPVADLERHANALTHVILAMAGDASRARHLHGGGQEYSHFRFQEVIPGYRGPRIYFNDTLTAAGRHRVFFLIQRGGLPRTVSFDFDVGPPEPQTP